MATVSVTEAKLTNIGNAIRTRAGTSSLMTLDEMVVAIGNITGGVRSYTFEQLSLDRSNPSKTVSSMNVGEERIVIAVFRCPTQGNNVQYTVDLPATGTFNLKELGGSTETDYSGGDRIFSGYFSYDGPAALGKIYSYKLWSIIRSV